MFLSIVIPVYNGADTIGRCLDSIYSQGLAESDFEVICVDDCSPELSTVMTIENYKFKDNTPSNLILIKHKVNKRQGGARNTGIRAANGEWIQFMDCDDFLIENCMVKLLDILKRNPDLDLLTFNHYIGTETEVIEKINRINNNTQVMTGYEYHIRQEIPSVTWECLFRKSRFYSYNVWFHENTRFEDVDSVIKYTILAGKVLYVPIDVYYHVLRKGQTSDIGHEVEKIRDEYLLSNRMANNAMVFKKISQYKTNGDYLMHYAALNRITFTKKDLWKLRFSERISLLREVRLPFKTGYRIPDFIYSHPVITSCVLCLLNQRILNLLIKGKKFKNDTLNSLLHK